MTKRLMATELVGYKVRLNDGRKGTVIDYDEFYIIVTEEAEMIEAKRNDFETEIRVAA